MAKFITGLFPDRAEAERAVDALEDLGYAPEDISVVLSPATCENDFRRDEPDGAVDEDVHVAANVGIGASFGGTLGAIIAGVTATGAIVGTGGAALPIVAGPIAAILAGAGAGGIAGGIVGLLAGIGVPETRAQEYGAGLERGAIVVGVNARPIDDAAVTRILVDHDYAVAALLDRDNELTGASNRVRETPRGADLPTRQV